MGNPAMGLPFHLKIIKIFQYYLSSDFIVGKSLFKILYNVIHLQSVLSSAFIKFYLTLFFIDLQGLSQNGRKLGVCWV